MFIDSRYINTENMFALRLQLSKECSHYYTMKNELIMYSETEVSD